MDEETMLTGAVDETDDENLIPDEWFADSADDDTAATGEADYTGWDEHAEEKADEPESEAHTDGETADTEAKAVSDHEAETENNEVPETKTFHLKHLSDEVDVDEGKVVELAQKGMDYDHVRGKLNDMEAENARLKEYEAFVNEVAASGDFTVEEIMDSTRAKLLVAKEQKEGRVMGEAEALQRVQRTRREAAQKRTETPKQVETQEAKPPEKTQEQLRQERQQEVIRDFVKAFPDRDPKTIPEDVLMDGLKNGDLAIRVLKHDLKTLRDENERLKLNRENEESSPRSMKTAGKSTNNKDPIFAGWDD